MPAVDSNGVSIYYQIQGQGQPLLLIHGLGSSSRDWEPQLPQFSEFFQVIAIDLRGHGRSDKPPGPYSMGQFAGDADCLLETLGLMPSHVVGISLGGMVAFQLALDFPAAIRKLVVVNSVPELLPRGPRDRLLFWQRLLIIRLLGMKAMGRVLAERFLPDPDQAPLREIFINRWAENDKAGYRASLKAAYGWSVRPRLGQIQVPTLIVGAEEDYFPNEEKAAYTSLIPDASLVIIKDSRHALPAEKPAEFNQVVLDFLLSGTPG